MCRPNADGRGSQAANRVCDSMCFPCFALLVLVPAKPFLDSAYVCLGAHLNADLDCPAHQGNLLVSLALMVCPTTSDLIDSCLDLFGTN